MNKEEIYDIIRITIYYVGGMTIEKLRAEEYNDAQILFAVRLAKALQEAELPK